MLWWKLYRKKKWKTRSFLEIVFSVITKCFVSWGTHRFTQETKNISLSAKCSSGDAIISACAEVHIYLNLSPCIIAVIIIKVIWNLLIKLTLCCVDFSFLIQVIGPETSRHLLNQSDSKLKTNRELSLTLSRVFSLVFVLFFSLFVLIGSMWYFLSSDWSLWFLWYRFYDTQSKYALSPSSISRLLSWLLSLLSTYYSSNILLISHKADP